MAGSSFLLFFLSLCCSTFPPVSSLFQRTTKLIFIPPTPPFKNPRSDRLPLLYAPNDSVRPHQNAPTALPLNVHFSQSLRLPRLCFGRDSRFLGGWRTESREEGGERGDWVGGL